MKYAILSVQNKVAGAQDHINVCLVEISSTIISVYRIVFTCLGMSNN